MNPPRRIDALTGVRIFLAVVVIVEHYELFLAALTPELDPVISLFSLGHQGVSLFFALSGLILFYTYGDKLERIDGRAWLIFIRRRAARIVPLQWMMLLVAGALVLLAGPLGLQHLPAAPLAELPGQILMVGDWGFREDVAALNWNPPAWSLHAEWFAYLLCPMLFVVLSRSRSRAAAGAVGAAGIAIVVLGLPALEVSSAPIAITGWFLLGTALGMALLYEWVPRGAPNDVIATGLIAIGGALVLVAPSEAVGNLGIAVLAIALLFIGLAEGRLAAALSWRPVVFWGEASYALYITHFLVIAALATPLLNPAVLDQSAPVRFGLAAGLVLALFAIAAAAHVWVERPAERKLRGSSRLRPTAGRGAPAPLDEGAAPAPSGGLSPHPDLSPAPVSSPIVPGLGPVAAARPGAARSSGSRRAGSVRTREERA